MQTPTWLDSLNQHSSLAELIIMHDPVSSLWHPIQVASLMAKPQYQHGVSFTILLHSHSSDIETRIFRFMLIMLILFFYQWQFLPESVIDKRKEST